MEYKVWLIGDTLETVEMQIGMSPNQRDSSIVVTLKAHVILNIHKSGGSGWVVRDSGGEKGYIDGHFIEHKLKKGS